MADHKAPQQIDEFYVGYLQMPDGHRRFISSFVIAMLVWSIGICLIIVITMRDPGYAKWNTGSMQSWTGTLIEQPYPMLIPDSNEPSALLVVSMGKRGAHERLSPHYGKHVTLRGYELNRDGRHLIELSPETNAIEAKQSPPRVFDEQLEHIEHALLTGEIVDGKCYLGAMKPGDGAGHQACATLCIRGGLPPMFVADTPEGDYLYYLLTIDGSTQLPERIFSMIGRQVKLEGTISDKHGIRMLQTSVDDIVRIN